MLNENAGPIVTGVRPVLFRIGDWPVPSYGVFVLLGILAGIWVYAREAKKNRVASQNALIIFATALIGGTLGAKLPVWVLHFHEIIHALSVAPWEVSTFLGGRTILGGLIGGAAAVWLVKRILGIREKKGNLFAPAIALGLAIGRIGCYLGGCCYGVATGSSWGIDFGDGIPRHPTQLYESLFDLILFVFLLGLLRRNPAPGILFRYFIRAYFSFRFLISFIRVENSPILWGLSGIQWLSLAVILFSFRDMLFNRLIYTEKAVTHG